MDKVLVTSSISERTSKQVPLQMCIASPCNCTARVFNPNASTSVQWCTRVSEVGGEVVTLWSIFNQPQVATELDKSLRGIQSDLERMDFNLTRRSMHIQTAIHDSDSMSTLNVETRVLNTVTDMGLPLAAAWFHPGALSIPKVLGAGPDRRQSRKGISTRTSQDNDRAAFQFVVETPIYLLDDFESPVALCQAFPSVQRMERD